MKHKMQRITHVPPIKHDQSNGGMWVFRVIMVRKKEDILTTSHFKNKCKNC
jgi:hypothetical protein